MSVQEIIGQTIGMIAMVFAVMSFQQTETKKVLILQAICNSLFMVHYVLLGAFTGAVMNIVSALRSVVFSNKDKKWASSPVWVYIFIAASIALGIATWDNAFSICPTLALIVNTIALNMKSTKLMRRFILPSDALWLTYNIYSVSIAGILTELFVITSIIVGMVRFDRKGNEKGTKDNKQLKSSSKTAEAGSTAK